MSEITDLEEFANNAFLDVIHAPTKISAAIYRYHMNLALEAKFAIRLGKINVANNYIYELHRSMLAFREYVQLYGIP